MSMVLPTTNAFLEIQKVSYLKIQKRLYETNTDPNQPAYLQSEQSVFCSLAQSSRPTHICKSTEPDEIVSWIHVSFFFHNSFKLVSGFVSLIITFEKHFETCLAAPLFPHPQPLTFSRPFSLTLLVKNFR